MIKKHFSLLSGIFLIICCAEICGMEVFGVFFFRQVFKNTFLFQFTFLLFHPFLHHTKIASVVIFYCLVSFYFVCWASRRLKLKASFSHCNHRTVNALHVWQILVEVFIFIVRFVSLLASFFFFFF